MAGDRRGGQWPIPEVEVDKGQRQVPFSTFYNASQGQDDAKGSERRPKRARRPPTKPTDGARGGGGEEDDDEGDCEGQPTETEDDASGTGSLGEAARAAKVYLRGPALLP
jgi:hypothetical protein